MFIFHLVGGLGNQMFQYAAAKSLSIKRGIPFKVFYQDVDKNLGRKYNLDIFRLSIDLANKNADIFSRRFMRLKSKIQNCLGFKGDNHFIFERMDFVFDKTFFNIPDNSIIYGFWQSEKYFIDIVKELREDFQIKLPPTGENFKIFNQINNDAKSVSLHIRRGDYVKFEKTNKIHGICTMDYYLNAIELISSKIGQPSFYIFSDDMNWVKDNFKIPYKTIFVDINNEQQCHEDLRLMSICKHNIIANSSFSWWGAWLNSNSCKIIISPIKWMNIDNYNTCDLIPETWIRI